MDDSENVDSTQQVTSKAPVTEVKNAKCVEASKRIAEKTKQAREEEKKKLAQAETIIAKERLSKAEAACGADTPPPPAEVETPVAEVKTDPQTLTTTQWLSVISIIISVVGIYTNARR